jgi:hypothetical protein
MRAENLQPVILIRLQRRSHDDVDVNQLDVTFVYPLLIGAATGIPCLAPRRQLRFAARQHGRRPITRKLGKVCIAFTPVTNHWRASGGTGAATPFLHDEFTTADFVRIRKPEETIRKEEELSFFR